MGEFIFAVVAAFLIFMVALPAVGILAGIFFRVGLPYAAGFWVGFVTVWVFSGSLLNWGMVLTLAGAWIFAVWVARRKYQEQKGLQFRWYEGHYTGALICLLLFAPLWSPTQAEVAPELEECPAEV